MYNPQYRPSMQGAFLPAVRLATAPRQIPVPSLGYSRATFGGRAHGTPGFLGEVRLGQAASALAQEYYNRARAALERYRFLKNQIATIDNKVARDTIIAWLGSPNITDTPEYRYARVLQDFTFDAAPAQEGIAAYDESRRRNRVDKLEEWNDDLNEKIEAARITYGSRPAPTQPGKDDKNGKPSGPDLTLPLIGVGALIALGLIFG